MEDAAPSDALRETYERRAELSYAVPVDLPDPRVDEKFGRMLELFESTLPADSVLDVGCGDGRFLAAIAQLEDRPPRLAGVDISARILETAAQMVAREGATAELMQGNLERLPFEDASFDVVLCVQVIEHVLDRYAAFNELARVLRPGGRLVLSTDSSHNRVSQTLNFPRRSLVRLLHQTGRRAKVTFPHGSFEPGELAALVERSGLTVEKLETFRFHLDGLNAAPIQRTLNGLERAFGSHGWGDIVAVVARRA